MDGLLIDSEPLWHLAEVEILGDLGVPLVRSSTRATKGMYVGEVTRYWFARHPWDGPDVDQVADSIVTRVGELVAERGEPTPGALDVVSAMAERGPIAVASSTPLRLIEAVLAHLGLADAFDVVCSAEHERYGKPHPAVFLTAAGALERRADHCVVYEDSPAGVLAAKAASMRCVAVPERSEIDLAQIRIADLVVGSLADLDLSELDQLVESWS